MNKNGLWYGYLEAGDKSTAVLRDPNLDTGNKKTVYLFNLARKEILEYTLAIVEPKLRPLKPQEKTLADEIDGAYGKARKGFSTTRRRSSIPDPAPAPRIAENEQEGEDEEDYDYEDMENVDDDEPLVNDEEDEVA